MRVIPDSSHSIWPTTKRGSYLDETAYTRGPVTKQDWQDIERP